MSISRPFLFCLALFVSGLISAQDMQQILKAAYTGSQSLQYGYYESHGAKKFMFAPDTIHQDYKVYFKKNREDSLLNCQFHLSTHDAAATNYQIYNGREFISATSADSAAIIYRIADWENEVNKQLREIDLYQPLTTFSYPLPSEVDLLDLNDGIDNIGTEIISGMPAHHIRIVKRMKEKEESKFRMLGSEFHFWISISDHVPLQYSVELIAVMGSDTLRQMENHRLMKFDFSNPLPQNIFEMESLPPFFQQKFFDPEEMKPK